MSTIIYLIIVLLSAGWAFYAEATLGGTNQEHLMPGTLLALVTLPLSSLIVWLFEICPEFFMSPFVQISCLFLCGFAQSAIIHTLARLLGRSSAFIGRQ